jgi:hypothetical protein
MRSQFAKAFLTKKEIRKILKVKSVTPFLPGGLYPMWGRSPEYISAIKTGVVFSTIEIFDVTKDVDTFDDYVAGVAENVNYRNVVYVEGYSWQGRRDLENGRTLFATVINAGGDWAVAVGISVPRAESKSNKKKWTLASKKLAQAQLKKSEAFIQTRVG